ncbi:Myb-DNA-bind-2 domain-containing protein [Mycena chlorophos]|uniref:Myb-DNA-bind-2 domain-containing protein n=1 Tax=Mycena chlorophos TaxID=658473 RepID=A0A8H6TK45_MYCCL|nr:Myb-DNA-bind-2 domain-containing protein [Mycena chlorophos]
MTNTDEAAQLFTGADGQPLSFLIHDTIINTRAFLEGQIEDYGGLVVSEGEKPDIILVQADELDKLRHAYKTHSNRDLAAAFVEPLSWVLTTVETGKVVHLGTTRRTTAGRTRNNFTTSEDLKLAHYLYVHVPDKSNGGRRGKIIFQQLMANGDALPQEYDWVHRHTWKSWRERYMKDQSRFDALIDELRAAEGELQDDPPDDADEWDQDHPVRADEDEEEEQIIEEGNRRSRRKRQVSRSAPESPSKRGRTQRDDENDESDDAAIFEAPQDQRALATDQHESSPSSPSPTAIDKAKQALPKVLQRQQKPLPVPQTPRRGISSRLPTGSPRFHGIGGLISDLQASRMTTPYHTYQEIPAKFIAHSSTRQSKAQLEAFLQAPTKTLTTRVRPSPHLHFLTGLSTPFNFSTPISNTTISNSLNTTSRPKARNNSLDASPKSCHPPNTIKCSIVEIPWPMNRAW